MAKNSGRTTEDDRGGGIRWAALALALALVAAARLGSAAETPGPWRYQLLPASDLIDDCPPCGRPTLQVPLRGTFDLRRVEENPLFARYVMENISFTAGFTGGPTYRVAGRGTYVLGGEVAVLQDMSLEVRIDNGFTHPLCFLTNASPRPGRRWPMIDATVGQTNGTFTQVYHLHLLAAPLREIWFSTTAGMTPGFWSPPTNHLGGGDLLSAAGRVAKFNRDLTRHLGLMPVVPDLGLDAVDVMPGGEIVFSLEQDVFSETLGPLHHGDLLSQRGRIVMSNQQLNAAFRPMPPGSDLGLDAVQVLDDGEVYFSPEKGFFSEALGRAMRSGDLLSHRGVLVQSNEQLVARFQPVDPRRDYGLDAFHVWPGGEVWFSVETGFQGPHFETYTAGDLLSDQGYVVYRNLELVAPFAPVEDLADFGLDALFIITDATPPAAAPRFTQVQRPRRTGFVELQWAGPGRVWQVLRATDVLGPWQPVSALIPDLMWNDTGPGPAQSYYRLQQW